MLSLSARQPRDEAGCCADEELVAWVPGRLLLEAARDPASMHALLEGPLRQGLFPAKLSAEALARQWGAVWLAAPAAERRALQTLLRARAHIQAAVGRLLAAREEVRGGAASEQAQSKLQVRVPPPPASSSSHHCPCAAQHVAPPANTLPPLRSRDA